MNTEISNTVRPEHKGQSWQKAIHLLLTDAEVIHFSSYFNIHLVKGVAKTDDYLTIQGNEEGGGFLTIVIKSKKIQRLYQVEAIQISSQGIPLKTRLLAQENVFMVVISIHKMRISAIFQNEIERVFFEKHIETNKAVFYDVIATPEIQFVIHQLSEYQPMGFLSDFYGEIKSKELLYFLFQELNLREVSTYLKLHQADIETIFKIRESITSDLSTAPLLPGLAVAGGMSETKMKMVFKQVFGTSIYDYYQRERMNKAAEWLRYKSVSDTGYLLGFSNLSHFARLFARHYNLTPKKYKASIDA